MAAPRPPSGAPAVEKCCSVCYCSDAYDRRRRGDGRGLFEASSLLSLSAAALKGRRDGRTCPKLAPTGQAALVCAPCELWCKRQAQQRENEPLLGHGGSIHAGSAAAPITTQPNSSSMMTRFTRAAKAAKAAVSQAIPTVSGEKKRPQKKRPHQPPSHLAQLQPLCLQLGKTRGITAAATVEPPDAAGEGELTPVQAQPAAVGR